MTYNLREGAVDGFVLENHSAQFDIMREQQALIGEETNIMVAFD